MATGLRPYLFFPGTARDALTRYHSLFGGELSLHTNAEMSQGGDPDAIGHGELSGPVSLFAADAAPGQAAIRAEGVLFALLGAADPSELHRWFDALAEGGEIVDPLQERPWGDWDGQVRDRFGVTWLIGYHPGQD
jgi:PhnB protein